MIVFLILAAFMAGLTLGRWHRRRVWPLVPVPPEGERVYSVTSPDKWGRSFRQMEEAAQRLANENPKDEWGVAMMVRTWKANSPVLVKREYFPDATPGADRA